MRIILEVVGFGSRAGEEVSTTLPHIPKQELLGEEIAGKTIQSCHDHGVTGTKLPQKLGEARAVFNRSCDPAILEEANPPNVSLPQQESDCPLLLCQT
jgi:hypothetical protein